jgi:Cu2+-exporting ATPase
MTTLCRHCATPFAEDSGVDGFCCAGCEQVFTLIQNEGLGDYYQWQDRAAQPLKERALSGLDMASLSQAQSRIEADAASGEAVFKAEGMSCMGCAWLIERLASNRPGMLSAECRLSAHAVRLKWRAREFDLPAFATELWRFGYRLEAQPIRMQDTPRLSPLALRCLLSAVFTGNALLLAAYEQLIEAAPLAGLLSLVCLVFTLMLGAAPFFLAAYRAWRIRRWHSDCIPVFALVGASALAVSGVVSGATGLSTAVFLLSLLVCVLISVRLLVSYLGRLSCVLPRSRFRAA